MAFRVALSRRVAATVGVVVLVCAPVTVATGREAADDVAAPKPGQVVTIAGTGEQGYSGDGGDAVDARLGQFLDIDVGPDGTVYVADQSNSRLRVIDSDGVIDTVAGTRARRSPERDVTVAPGWIWSPRNTPQSVAVGDDGTVYVAASENIYRIGPDGSPEVIGGGGEERFDDGEGDDGGPAVGAWIYKPSDIAVDAEGNVYIADANNQRIRRIDTDGTITTVVGGGELALDDAVGGPATEADAYDVATVAVDSRGTVYFGTEAPGRPTVWKVEPDGSLGVAAGNGQEGYTGDGGPAVDAQLPSPPGGLAVDADDNLYLTDAAVGHVRRVDIDGVITTVGPVFAEGGFADVAVGPDGDLFVTAGAQIRMRVRAVDGSAPGSEASPPGDPAPDRWADEEAGTVVTVAGTGEEPEPPANPPPPPSLREAAVGLAVAGDEGLFFADPDRHRVVRVGADGATSVVAGTGEPGFSGDDGPATGAELSWPSGLAVGADGTLYIADSGNGRIRAVDPSGDITTVAGSGAPRGDIDDSEVLGDGGPATAATLVEPRDVAVGADGTLYVADGRGARVRAVDGDGTIRTVAGGGDRWAHAADGHPATDANLWEPNAVVVDDDGNVYFTGDGVPSVRKVDTDGVLTTVVGDSYLDTGEGGFGGDGGPATRAEINTPRDLAIGPDGGLYIADTFNSRIRRVDGDGVITTVAGTGERRDTGDGGPASDAAVDEPEALAFEAEGNLYVAGSGRDRIHRVDADGAITTVADLTGDTAPDESRRATETPLGGPRDLAVDRAGALYVVETHTGLVRRVDPDGTLSTVTVGPNGNQVYAAAALAPAPDGSLYAVVGGALQRVYPDGAVVMVAGGGGSSQAPDEVPQATTVMMNPSALAVGPDGTLYIADTTHAQVYRLDRDGGLTSIAGDADLGGVEGMAVDRDGNVYLADNSDNVVRRVAPDGAVSRFAGNGESSYPPDEIGDGGPATEAVVISPRTVAVGHDGDVYISSVHGIRRVGPDGVISTVVESDEVSIDGVDGATAYHPADTLALDAYGNLFFSEPDNHRVRVVVRPGEISDGVSPAVLVAGGGAGAALLAGAGAAVWRRRRQAARDDAAPDRQPVLEG